MASTVQSKSVADVVSKGPPPIHALKFEPPLPYNGLRWMASLSEGVGSLLLCIDLLTVLYFLGKDWWPLIVASAPILLMMLIGGIMMVSLAELIRLFIRMQHDAQRTREYMHYALWSLLTQRDADS